MGGVASEKGEKVAVWDGPINVVMLKETENPLLINS